MELQLGQTRKMSKFDSLKPILTLLENVLVREGLSQHEADMVVLDIAERLVTAGYGWDKILQYQSKVDLNRSDSLTNYLHMTAGRTSVQQEARASHLHVQGPDPSIPHLRQSPPHHLQVYRGLEAEALRVDVHAHHGDEAEGQGLRVKITLAVPPSCQVETLPSGEFQIIYKMKMLSQQVTK